MSFMSEVIWEGYANTSSSEALKEQFNKFCDWCLGIAMEIVIFVEENTINCTFR